MNTRWDIQDRTLNRRAGALLKKEMQPLRLRQRIDVVLVIGIVSGLSFLALLYLGLIRAGDRHGQFDAPLIHPIEDKRILVNVRDDIGDHPMLDAVMHRPSGQVYIAQEGATVHRYSPSTGLWSSEKPFSTTSSLVDPNLVRLRSGCGSDPLSDRAEDCPDPKSLWAITAGHGLVRHRNGKWEIGIGDNTFVAADGTPVENSELTAAAVSPDNRWLAVGTKDGSIGIYDIERRLWAHSEAISGTSPSRNDTHIVWWRGRFWIGSPDGLSSLKMDAALAKLVPVPGISGRIIDLDVDQDDGLWIMARKDCAASGEYCLWLGKLQGPNRKPVTLIDERNVFSNLDMVDLMFAQQWGDRLVLAGDAGIFSYDARHHTWDRYFDGHVVTTLPMPDGNSFFFGYTGGAGVIDKKGRFETWPIPNEQVVKLVHGNRDDLLALTATGAVFSIAPPSTTNIMSRTHGTALDPRSFTAAAAVSDTVLFLGPEGALLHSISTRGYQDISTHSLPDWLLSPEVQLISSGNHLYALSPQENNVTVYTLPGDRVIEADFGSSIPPESVPMPVRRVRDWDGQGIGLIAGYDQVYRFTPNGEEVLSSPSAPAMEHQVFHDVAPLGRGLAVLTEDGLRYYNGESRVWSDFFSTLADDQIVEVDTLGSYLFARTGKGRLVYFREDGEPAQAIIGDKTGFNITDGGLSDALSVGQHLYLAGEGWIERYNLDLRHIDKRWDLPTSGPVRLKGIVDGQPLAISENIAMLGDATIETEAGPVTSLFDGHDFIWTVRDHMGQRYLKQYFVDASHKLQASRCFFRNPSAGDAVTRILDARTLPGRSTVAVATDAGLRFYDPQARSWFAGPPDLIPDGGRLYVLDQYLVLVEEHQEQEDGFQVSFVPIESVDIPDSCLTSAVSLRQDTVKVRAVAIDEGASRVAWIRPDGAVYERQFPDDLGKEILPPSGSGPASASLKRVYDRPGYLLFTTDDSIWRYELSQRQWSQILLRFDLLTSPILDINVEETSGLETVIARSETGEFYLGSFGPSDLSVQMSQVYTPTTASFDAPAEDLLDVQGGTVWTFVLENQIKYFDPTDREWLPGAELGDPDRSLLYNRALGRSVVVGEKGRVWWIAQEDGDAPSRFARYEREQGETTALDSKGMVWRLPRDGVLSSCSAPSEGDYMCIPSGLQNFALDPRDVKRAFRWQDIILFETEQGLRALEQASGAEILLPPAARWLTGTVLARVQGSEIRMYGHEGELALRKNEHNHVETAPDIGGRKIVARHNLREAWLLALTVSLLAYFLTAVATSRRSSTTCKCTFKLAVIGVIVLAIVRICFSADQKKWMLQEGLIRNEWPTLQKNAVRLRDGRWVYDPIITLSTDQQGALVAVRPSGKVQLATRGTVQLELPPALDSGWLRWDRSLASFMVASTSGLTVIPKHKFVTDGHLLFETVDAILAESPDRLHVANQYGIWTHNQSHLGLDHQAIMYRPLPLRRPIGAAHGCFLTKDGAFPVGESFLRRVDPWSRFRFGDVTISEQVRRREVTGTVTIGPATMPAFSDRGFIWDLDRRGLAYSQDGLLLQSEAGIHPLHALADFDPGPNHLARHGGTLHYEANEGVFLLRGSTWYRRDPAGWTMGVENPITNRTIIQDATWAWTLREGTLDVELSNPSDSITLTRGASGYSFSSDQLLDAAVHRDQLFIMTESFLEVASQSDEIGALNALRLPPSATDQLEEMSSADTSVALLRRHRDAISRWDPSTRQFLPVGKADDPYRRRLLVETDCLRFTAYPDHIVKELSVSDVSGSDSWVRFDFIAGRFPFDIVTSVAARDDELYVGTKAGLQVYSGITNTSGYLKTGFNNMDHIFHLRERTAAPLVEVSQVGVPQDGPELVMARSPVACIEKRPREAFAPCHDPSLLDHELRVKTDLWQWTTHPDGSTIGQYRNNATGLKPNKISIVEGRFPHDHLRDVVICNGQAFSMWQRNAGWITVYPDETIQLNPGLQNYVLPDDTIRFICVDHNITSNGVTISPGLYVEGNSQQIWQFSGTQWKKVTNSELVPELLAYADRPPILDRNHLRLLSPRYQEPYHFEQRALNGEWLPVPWESGRLALDWWHELLVLSDQLWAATPVGLVSFSRDATGQVMLDADSVIVVREPVDQQGVCRITDLDVESGDVLVRCNADRTKVYRGRLDGQRDTGVFKLYTGEDPFVEREMVSEEATGYWRWRLVDRERGNPGSLVGFIDQHEIQLVRGRFDFDTIDSVALFETNLLEIGTQAGGWFRAPRASLHVRDLQRPEMSEIDPTTITGVGITRVGEKQRLCLSESDGDYVRFARDGAPERTESCPEYLGDDGFWQYARDGEWLSITTPNAVGGAGVRQLEAGRFTDDIVSGLPTTGKDTEGVFYLLPTRAGVLHLDRDFKSVGLHVPPFPGLPDGSTPGVLFMLGPESPIYASESTFYHLDEVRQPVAGIKLYTPRDAMLQAVEDGPQDFIRTRWAVRGEGGWALVRRSDFAPLLHDSLLVNLSKFERFDEHRADWGDPDPWLELRFGSSGIDLFRLGSAHPYRVDVPGELDLIAPILFKERLLLIGEQELMDVNLERAMQEVFILPPDPPALDEQASITRITSASNYEKRAYDPKY